MSDVPPTGPPSKPVLPTLEQSLRDEGKTETEIEDLRQKARMPRYLRLERKKSKKPALKK